MTAALIADDEPLLREHLAGHLARLWPALQIVAQARNGREAVQMAQELRPDIVFLDVHMPGLDGIAAAREICRRDAGVPRPQLVFVTAYEQYAVQAFEHGAIDYLVKPFDAERLAETVTRLRERSTGAGAAGDGDGLDALLARLSRRLLEAPAKRSWLQWIKASVGNAVRLIPVDEVVFLRSDEKYTLVVWAGGEALIRKPIRELVDELDPEVFAQIHRSAVVNLRHVAQVVRGDNDSAVLHLRQRSETLPVSRSYLHLFRQM